MNTVAISFFQILFSLAEAIDLVSEPLADHHKKVAYIAHHMGRELGLSDFECQQLLMAGLLHDIGVLSTEDDKLIKYFDESLDKNKQGQLAQHAEYGYALLYMFAPLRPVADLIRHHHVPWENGDGVQDKEKQVSLLSHVLHIADRVAVLIPNDVNTYTVLDRRAEVVTRIQEQNHTLFHPDHVEAFLGLAAKENFWFDLASPDLKLYIISLGDTGRNHMSWGSLLQLAQLTGHVIDFRSSYTATHSSGVAASAVGLAKLMGFSDTECQMMKVAGYFHDFGKLAVPVETLEKIGKLSESEFNIIKSHTYYSYRILEKIDNFDVINQWASLHHERLDGSGYPFQFGRAELTLGARIMAVADVFTALTENRPYRKGMLPQEALKIVGDTVRNRKLDPHIYDILSKNFDYINDIRNAAQEQSVNNFQQFRATRKLQLA